MFTARFIQFFFQSVNTASSFAQYLGARIAHYLHEWQTLVGSLIGAAIPLALVLLSRWYFEHRDYLLKVEKVFAASVRNTVEAERTVWIFSEDKLTNLIAALDQQENSPNYFYSTAFFPLFSVSPFPEDLLNHSTWSGYVDSWVVQLLQESKDFESVINDMRRQFEGVLESHRTLALAKANTPHELNRQQKRDIEAYREYLRRDFFGINVREYLRRIVTARTALNALRKTGFIVWQFRFARRSFRYFRSYSDFNDFPEKGAERVKVYLEKKTEEKIKEVMAILLSPPPETPQEAEVADGPQEDRNG